MQISKISVCVCAFAICAGMAVHAGDTPAQAAARAALMQKMQELNGGTAVAPQTPAPAKTVTAAPKKAAAPAATKPTPAAQPATSGAAAATPAATTSGDSAAQVAARAALEAKMAELGTPVTPTPAPARVAVPNGQIPSVQAAAKMDEPLAAPPLPISMSKEEKLARLLNLYMANKISPEQYHEQRAAIVGGK